MKFADLRGHERTVARLAHAADERRVASAYLVVGPSGIGKRTLADAFAARLLCSAPAGDACGSCPQCTRVAAGTHPDLLVVARDAERRDIRIEQARELCRWFGLRPLMAERKVAIVDGAEHLNDHAQNALLKTLEEPPGSAVLLLIATSPGLLLPTVRSRCQRVRLDPLSPDAVCELLLARGLPPAEAQLLAAEAEGSPGRALELAGEEAKRARAHVHELLPRLATRSAVELSSAAHELTRGALDAALGAAIAWYRDVLAVRLGRDADRLRNPGLVAATREAAVRATPEVVLRQLKVVCDTMEAIERNAHRQLALETMLLALRALERGEREPWTSTT